MEAARYRLRFITGVVWSAASYGSGLYGDGTYGQRASDRIDSYDFIAIPLPAGHPTYPSWIYAQGDCFPDFAAVIASRDEMVYDLSSVAGAKLILRPLNGPVPSADLSFDLTIDSPATKGKVRRQWQVDDLALPGVYRPCIVLTFLTTRRLTIPFADINTLTIREVTP